METVRYKTHVFQRFVIDEADSTVGGTLKWNPSPQNMFLM